MFRFFRNREIRRLTIGLLLLTMTAAGVAGLCLDWDAGAAAGLTGFLLSTAALLFTYRRYRRIDQLSAYLHRLSSGERRLDLRDNEEGELSILKNEIYKVTVLLAEYNDQLQKEKGRLADSLSDISHQLKTPLTSMTVMADLLSKSDLPAEKRREFTGRLRSQLERLQWLVASLLKIARLDAGVVVFKSDVFSVQKLVESAAAPLLIPLELKGLTLETDGPDITMEGDEGWLREALVNLMKNAMEHTPSGGTLRIFWTGNPLYTEIAVEDSGEGIPPEDLPHIFTRFYRGKNAGPDSVGIGLAMAREIVERQNGRITAQSRLGEGTCFRIRLYKTVV